MEPRPLFYTVRQVADRLQCSENTVLEAIRRKQLPAVLVGDRYRIPVGALYALARGGWKEGEVTWKN